jgi:hypothetical protein
MNYFVDADVNQTRHGAAIASDIPLQLDLMSQQEASFYGGAAPYFRYHGAIQNTTGLDMRPKDLLTNPDAIDPDTSAPPMYRIVTSQYFPDVHWELVLDRARGTT